MSKRGTNENTFSKKMRLEESSYVVWNNKGGVGKSTITFHMSHQYAAMNPTKKVIVIDMCPQADLSSSYINQNKLSEIWNQPINKRNTIGTLLLNGAKNCMNEEDQAVEMEPFLTQVCSIDRNMPCNLFLICGDPILQELDRFLGSRPISFVNWDENKYNTEINMMLKKSVKDYMKRNNQEVSIFIDTNPAFTIYTSIAICGSQRIIIPVKGDDYSKVGVEKLVQLIYGPSQIGISFAAIASKLKFDLPKIHLAVANQFKFDPESQVFDLSKKAICQALYDQFTKNPGLFSFSNNGIEDIMQFEKKLFTFLEEIEESKILTQMKRIIDKL